MTKKSRIIIVGAGPVGLFVFYLLKQLGYRPILLSSEKKINFISSNPLPLSYGVGGKANLWGGWIDGNYNHTVRKFLKIKRTKINQELKALGFIPKKTSTLNFRKLHSKNLHVEKLLIKDNKVIGVCYGQKKIYGDHVFLCCGPLAASLILQNSGLLEQKTFKIMNHMSSGYIGLIKNTKITQPQCGYHVQHDGVIEFKGPIPGNSIHSHLKDYFVYKVHYIGSMSGQYFQIKNKKIIFKIQFSALDKQRAKRREKKLKSLLKKCKVEPKQIIKVQQSLNFYNIAHEVSYIRPKKKMMNLSLMGTIQMKKIPKSFPTAEILQHTYDQLIHTIKSEF